jgi:hypothetical protein
VIVDDLLPPRDLVREVSGVGVQVVVDAPKVVEELGGRHEAHAQLFCVAK